MKKSALIAFVALFLALCILPGAAYIAGYTAENRENRPLARPAKLIDRDGLNLNFPKDFDGWWEDHFGLREELVTVFHALTMSTARDTLNEKVTVGKGNYLFYTESLNDYIGIDLMSDADIEKAATVVRLIKEYCESRDMRFVFMNAPNKNTIYPEYMPSYLAVTRVAGNRARLYAALSDAGVETLDLAEVLLLHKADGDLYYEQDTHWNERGARIAYRAIISLVAARSEYDAYADDEGRERTGWRGDLHEFVLPASSGSNLKYVEYPLRPVGDYAVDEGADPARDVSFGTTCAKNSARMLLFRDSFGEALIPLLSANTGRAVYSKEFPYNLVFTEEPFDVVLIELVERNIPNLLISAPLMPGVETSLPEDVREVAAEVRSRSRNGYTQLYGCFEGGSSSNVYIELTRTDGVNLTFEAFPILDEACETAVFSSPAGFVLTLPQGTEYADVRVFTACI